MKQIVMNRNLISMHLTQMVDVQYSFSTAQRDSALMT